MTWVPVGAYVVKAVVNSLGPDCGCTLRCGVCRKEISTVAGKFTDYVIHGWPKCCGEQMSPSTERKAP